MTKLNDNVRELILFKWIERNEKKNRRELLRELFLNKIDKNEIIINHKKLLKDFYKFCYYNQYKYNHFRCADLFADIEYAGINEYMVCENVVFYE